jgi:hypothetical protein
MPLPPLFLLAAAAKAATAKAAEAKAAEAKAAVGTSALMGDAVTIGVVVGGIVWGYERVMLLKDALEAFEDGDVGEGVTLLARLAISVDKTASELPDAVGSYLEEVDASHGQKAWATEAIRKAIRSVKGELVEEIAKLNGTGR